MCIAHVSVACTCECVWCVCLCVCCLDMCVSVIMCTISLERCPDFRACICVCMYSWELELLAIVKYFIY